MEAEKSHNLLSANWRTRKSGHMIRTKGPLVSSPQIQKPENLKLRVQGQKIVIPTREEGEEIHPSTVFLFRSSVDRMMPHWEGRSLPGKLIQMLISSWNTFPGASRTLTSCLGILIPGKMTREMRRYNELSSEESWKSLWGSLHTERKSSIFFLSYENDLTNMMGTLPKKQQQKIVPNDSNHYRVKNQGSLETWIYVFIHTRILSPEISWKHAPNSW